MKKNNNAKGISSNTEGDNLFKNTVIFAISNIATKLIAFVLIPIYTRAMSTGEYGISDLLYTIGTVIAPLFTLNISEAVYRFLMDKDADEEKIITIALKVLMFGSLISVPIILLVMYFTPYREYFVVYSIYLISVMFFQVLSMNLRGKRQLKQFATSNIMNVILVAISSCILIFVMRWGIYGFFLSYIFANVISSIYAGKSGNILKIFSGAKIDSRIFREMVKYSIVLVPTTFMWWIINSSDKIMISWIISESANGIYSISSRMPMILTTIAGIFNQAWVFTAVDKKGAADEGKYVNRVFHSMYVAVFLMAILFIIILKPFLALYVSQDFFVAWEFAPPLIAGGAFVAMGTFLSVSYNVHKDSKGFLFSGLSGAIINIVLNSVLIPILGISGAAIATLISYVGVFLYRLFDTRKYVEIKFRWSYIVPIILLCINCAMLYFDDTVLTIVVQLAVFGLYVSYYRRELHRLIKGTFKKTVLLLKGRKPGRIKR